MKLLLILVGAFLLPAESVHSLLPEPGAFKVSGSMLLHWNINAKDRGRDAVEAFDRDGMRVFGIDIYKLLPSAQMVSIDDVAVGATSRLPLRLWLAKMTTRPALGCCNLAGMADWRN